MANQAEATLFLCLFLGNKSSNQFQLQVYLLRWTNTKWMNYVFWQWQRKTYARLRAPIVQVQTAEISASTSKIIFKKAPSTTNNRSLWLDGLLYTRVDIGRLNYPTASSTLIKQFSMVIAITGNSGETQEKKSLIQYLW